MLGEEVATDDRIIPSEDLSAHEAGELIRGGRLGASTHCECGKSGKIQGC